MFGDGQVLAETNTTTPRHFASPIHPRLLLGFQFLRLWVGRVVRLYSDAGDDTISIVRSINVEYHNSNVLILVASPIDCRGTATILTNGTLENREGVDCVD